MCVTLCVCVDCFYIVMHAIIYIYIYIHIYMIDMEKEIESKDAEIERLKGLLKKKYGNSR
jgi:hypothetical protein